MKKLLLCLMAALFLAGCACTKPTRSKNVKENAQKSFEKLKAEEKKHK